MIKKILLCLIVSLFLIQCSKKNELNKSQLSNEEIEKIIDKGDYYFYRPYIKDNYNKALKYYLDNKGNPISYTQARFCYRFIDDFNNAIKINSRDDKWEYWSKSDYIYDLICSKKYEDALDVIFNNLKKEKNESEKQQTISLYRDEFILCYYKLGKYEEAKKYYRGDNEEQVWFIPIFMAEKDYEKVDKIIKRINYLSSPEVNDIPTAERNLPKNDKMYIYFIIQYYIERNMLDKALSQIEYAIALELTNIYADVDFVEYIKKEKLGWNNDKFNPMIHDQKDIKQNGGLDYRNSDPNRFVSVSEMFKLKSEILKAMGENKKAKEASKQSKEWEGKKGYRDFIEFIDDDYMKDDPEYQRLFLNE